MSDEIDRPASEIIDAFGGIRPMAARLDVPVSTVQGWKQRDTIPAARMETVRAAARAASIDLDSVKTDGSASTDSIVPKSDGEPAENRETPPDPLPAASVDRPPAPSRGGGVAMLALAVAVGVGGWVWWSTAGPGVTSGDNARLSALEGRIARLADVPRENAPGVDSAALAGLTKDVAALQARLSDLPSPDLATALAPLRAEIDGLRDALAAQGGQTGGGSVPDPAVLARLDALDVEVQNAIQIASTNMQAMSGALLEFDTKLRAFSESETKLVTRIEALETGRTTDEIEVSRASALALAAGQLRTALERGSPFTRPLDLAGSLGDDDPALNTAFGTLRESAETGVATGPALELSFAGMVPDLLAAGRSGEAGDLVDRLTDRINDIVSIRRTGADVQGDDIEARIARAEIFLANRDVAGAMSALKDVGDAPGEILSPWLSRARAHLDAHDALAVIETQAIARLRAEGGS